MGKWQIRALLTCFITSVLLFSGCSTDRNISSYAQPGDDGRKIVSISETLIGSPYRYGGESPSGFDCSGLVRYVYRQIGINVPHSSRLLFQQADRVSLNRIQPGDLLFFRISKNKVSHVGIYASKGQFIHAPSSGKQVSIARLDSPYWEKRLVGAGRFH